jgi:hypothetical protein
MWKVCTIVCRSNTVKLYLNHWSHMRIWTRKLQYIFNQDGYLRCSCGKPSKKLQFLQVVETHAHGTMRMKQAYHHTRGVSCDTGSKPSAWGSDYCQAKLPTVFSQHMMPWKTNISRQTQWTSLCLLGQSGSFTRLSMHGLSIGNSQQLYISKKLNIMCRQRM